MEHLFAYGMGFVARAVADEVTQCADHAEVAELRWAAVLAMAPYELETHAQLDDGLRSMYAKMGLPPPQVLACARESATWFLAKGPHPHGHEAFYLVFRGTKNLDDMLDNLLLSPQQYGPDMLHSGFLGKVTKAMSLQSHLAAHLSNSAVPLYVIGHSLGGALALTLLATGLPSRHRGPKHIIMFGAPKIFYGQPSKTVAQMGARVTLVVNNNDVVPRLLGSNAGALKQALSLLCGGSSPKSDHFFRGVEQFAHPAGLELIVLRDGKALKPLEEVYDLVWLNLTASLSPNALAHHTIESYVTFFEHLDNMVLGRQGLVRDAIAGSLDLLNELEDEEGEDVGRTILGLGGLLDAAEDEDDETDEDEEAPVCFNNIGELNNLQPRATLGLGGLLDAAEDEDDETHEDEDAPVWFNNFGELNNQQHCGGPLASQVEGGAKDNQEPGKMMVDVTEDGPGFFNDLGEVNEQPHCGRPLASQVDRGIKDKTNDDINDSQLPNKKNRDVGCKSDADAQRRKQNTHRRLLDGSLLCVLVALLAWMAGHGLVLIGGVGQGVNPSATPPLQKFQLTAGASLAEKAALIRQELQLDQNLSIKSTLAEAKSVLGLEASGTLAEQINHVAKELTLTVNQEHGASDDWVPH